MLIHLQFELPIREVRGEDDLAAALAFDRGGMLVDCAADDEGQARFYVVSVDADWSDEVQEAFQAEFIDALRLASGVPWLSTEQVVQFIFAERQVRPVLSDEQADAMFLALRRTPTEGWPPLLEQLSEWVGEGGAKELGAAAARAALMVLRGWLGPRSRRPPQRSPTC